MSKVMNWVAKRHWWIIALVILLISIWEALESIYPRMHSLYNIGLLIYPMLVLFIGLMLDFSSRKINTQSEAMKILDYKHHLSQEFSICTEWDALIDYIVRLPGMIAATEQSYLFVANPLSERFECLSQWAETGHETIALDSGNISKKYLDESLRSGSKLVRCQSMSAENSASLPVDTFCLPIQYGGSLLGILQFRLKNAIKLTNEQAEIFENIGDDIAIAFKIGQERQAFNEMSRTKAALEERRTVSHYLHDHLGQNLGYVNLKLGQLISEIDQLSSEEMLNDLEHMREAANESYDIMRGILETINLETTPLLANLLTEHARKVARRAHIEISFKSVGEPVPIDKNIQRAIYFAFQESLSNVERHARASKVDVRAEWTDDHFELSIYDNGIGFSPPTINKNQHFGLEIMRERMAKAKGRVTVTTNENTGTLVNFWVPTSPVKQIRGVNG